MSLIHYILQAFTLNPKTKAEAFQAFIVTGAGLGILLALITLFIGLKKRKNKVAIWGFIAVLLGGIFIGMGLSIPLTILFIWLSVKPNKDKLLDMEEEEDLKDIELDDED